VSANPFTRSDLVVTLIPVSLGLIVWVAFRLRRHFAQRRELERIRKENLERREFLIAKMDQMRDLLANRDIPLAEMKARQYLLLAEMETRNENGDLDPLIADNAEYLEEEFRKLESG